MKRGSGRAARRAVPAPVSFILNPVSAPYGAFWSNTMERTLSADCSATAT